MSSLKYPTGCENYIILFRSPKGKNVADLDGDYLEPVKLSNDFTYLELSKKASNIYEDFANYYHM